MGILHRIIFSHTPDEARSGGLAKACVPRKNYSVPEKLEYLIEILLYFVYGHKCLFLISYHSGMGISTMMSLYESY